MKKVSLIKRIICGALLIALCCSLGGCSVYHQYVSESGGVPTTPFGDILIQIQSDSMSPVLSAGDKIICQKVDDPGTLSVGDIISFWTVINGERVIVTHRIYEIYVGSDGKLIFATKGDNNISVDALVVHEAEVIGKYARHAILGMF